MSSDEQQATCLVCSVPLSIRFATGRKSGKPFVMLICPQDGRHFRAFITHQPYVKQVMDHLEICKEQG